ncbi:MAG: peptide-modifying radical SAM enzyme CbpB [Nitrospira sp.]|nr:peptide-modifying radical SAM enzyme CbpB [Nitrospira sp.]
MSSKSKSSNDKNNTGRGLTFSNVDENWKLALDPENIFWSILPKNDGEFMLPADLIDLYKKEMDHLNKKMHDFRFNEPLNCVYIDPTDRCNANCPYCYIPSKIRTDGTQMTWEQLDLALSKVADHFKDVKKKPVIVYHAAEPLMVKDLLFKSIKKYHKKMLFGIQTNALLLEREDVDFIKKYRVGIGISLDAATAVDNNKSRVSRDGGGNYKKAVQAIDWFKNYPGLNVICTVTNLNVTKLSQLVKFLHKKEVPMVLLNPVRLTQKRTDKLKAEDSEYAENLIKAVNTSMELTRKTGRQIVIGNFANVLLAIISPTARRMMCDISPCGGGRTFLTVTADGAMVPCGEFIGFKEFSGGNIYKTSIETAMNSKPFKEIRARMVENIDECDVCDFRHICGSPCPAEMYGRGDINKKAVFCDFYKEIIKYAFKMIAEDNVKYLLRDDSLEQMQYEYQY